jgi:arylsulfatase A
VLDGASFLPVLEGKSVARATPLYWHFNRTTSEPKVAMRVGDWKILATLDKNLKWNVNDITDEDERIFKEAEPAHFSLYNLRNDIAEKNDLCTKEPVKLAELKTLLLAKYREVRAESPTWPAWQFTDAEGKRIEWPDYWLKKRAAKKK